MRSPSAALQVISAPGSSSLTQRSNQSQPQYTSLAGYHGGPRHALVRNQAGGEVAGANVFGEGASNRVISAASG